MKSTLLELFTSKKFLAALTAIIVYLAGRFGFDVDTAVLDRIYAALLVYIGAQGLADNGKSAAQVAAAAAGSTASAPPSAASAPRPAAGGVAGVAVVLLVIGVHAVAGVLGPA